MGINQSRFDLDTRSGGSANDDLAPAAEPGQQILPDLRKSTISSYQTILQHTLVDSPVKSEVPLQSMHAKSDMNVPPQPLDQHLKNKRSQTYENQTVNQIQLEQKKSSQEQHIEQSCVEQPQPERSHGDRVSIENKDPVSTVESPLTYFLNNRSNVFYSLDNNTKLDIWLEAFDTDWQGDLTLLPDLKKQGYLKNHHLCRVKSRDMYTRLCGLYGWLSETCTMFQRYDDAVNKEIVVGGRKCVIVGRIPRIRLLHIAMRNMWLDVLEDRINRYPYAVANDCIVEGHKELLKYLVETGKIVLKEIKYLVNDYGAKRACMDEVARMGDLELLKMLHEVGNNNSITKEAMNNAAGNGRLDIVKWLHENRFEGCTTRAMDLAAENGHLDVVAWLHVNRKEGCTTDAMDYASNYGHLAVVKYLHEKRFEGCTMRAMDYAAKNGHLHVVKWLHENRIEGCTKNAMNYAALYGYLHVVKYLHENRSEGCTIDAIDWAAQNGHDDVVEWLLANRTEGFTEETFMQARDSIRKRIFKLLESHLHLMKA